MAIRAPIAIEIVLAHATNATTAVKGPKTIRLPIGNMVNDSKTGAKKTLAKVMSESCSISARLRGSVAGNLMAPDEIKPVVEVRLRKNTTTNVSAKYIVNPTANRASGFPIETSNAEAAKAIMAIIVRIIVVIT